MLLQDLIKEAPELKKRELPARGHKPFFSAATLVERFDILKEVEGDDPFVVLLRKTNEFAAIGVRGKRESDGADGVEIRGLVEFKRDLNLSGVKDTPIKLPKTLQVALADVSELRQRQGWGLRLYSQLASSGYTVISDNTQYLGGQAIWKKIASEAFSNGYKVHVIDHGEIRLDTRGEPIVYDGSNIDDSDLWSENADKRYTLFALSAA